MLLLFNLIKKVFILSPFILHRILIYLAFYLEVA